MNDDDDDGGRMAEALGLAAVLVAGIIALIYWIEWTG
jgi:hypothetical protein